MGGDLARCIRRIMKRLTTLTVGLTSLTVAAVATAAAPGQVNANGKELYFGEFGRSGTRYTVRVTDTYSTESDLLEHLIG